MAKKSFKDIQGAAAMFISDPAPAVPAEPAAPAQATTGTVTPPQGYRVNHAVIETKSKRVQLLMQPTLHARIKAAADAQGLSFNDLVHRILEDAVKE